MGPADSRRISRAPRYSGLHWASPPVRVPGFHLLWRRFPAASTSESSCRIVFLLPRRRRNASGLGSSAFARHYLRNHCCFLFLRVLRCFSSPRSPPLRDDRPTACRLPHSDIAGSRAICASPALFAAYHVLLRLREPRHPPSALLCFSSSWHFRAGLICLQLALLFRLLFIANMSKIFLCGE